MAYSYYIYQTPLGRVSIESNGSAISAMTLGVKTLRGEQKPTALTNVAANQLQEYLAGKRHRFELPLAPEGTAFQQQVWQQLQTIPYGQTCTYGDLATALGKPTATRAVGGANNKNPIPIFIPCHRVIGANGNLVGYAYGLKIKEYLLALEAQNAQP